MKASHLRVEVWTRNEAPAVVVAFGGTVFTSGKDWKSNLRWFLPKHKDEYSQIVDLFSALSIVLLSGRRGSHFVNRVLVERGTGVGNSTGGGASRLEK